MSEPEAVAAVDPSGTHGRARWDDRYRAREQAEPAGSSSQPPGPPSAMARMAALLPTSGRAVDLAGGDGGGGLFLARRGLDVTVVDHSTVALDRAVAFAAAAELRLGTVPADLANAGLASVLAAIGQPAPIVITLCNYLDRSLLASVADELPSGARFVVAIATTTNLERNERPPAHFLLRPGELGPLVVGGGPPTLRVLHHREGWAEGRHVAELVVEAR